MITPHNAIYSRQQESAPSRTKHICGTCAHWSGQRYHFSEEDMAKNKEFHVCAMRLMSQTKTLEPFYTTRAQDQCDAWTPL